MTTSGGVPKRSLSQRMELLFARLLLRLPERWMLGLCGGRPIVVEGQALHPEMQLLLAARSWRGGATLRAETPALARKRVRDEARMYSGEPVVLGSVRDLEIPGGPGAIRARHYAPLDASGSKPLLVFFHGGGFVVGDLDTHDEPCRLLCRHAGLPVLSVDYRLAPEHPFPAAVEDCCRAFVWAVEHARELGADPARIGVGGDSAGGNLAAVVAQASLGGQGPWPAFQLLIYPTMDRGGPERPSLRQFAEGFFLTRADMEWFTLCYLGERVELHADPRASPLRASELRDLCPALIVTAGFDPLRDEGEEYAAALEAAGVPVRLLPQAGFIHGFLNMAGVSPAAHAALVSIARALRDLAVTEAAPPRPARN